MTIRVENVSKAFKRPSAFSSFWKASVIVHALREVSAEAPSGSITALMGENGSGKTTLLRLMAGLLEPDSGVVDFGAKRGTYISAHDRQFYDRLTGYENLRFYARLGEWPLDRIPEAAAGMGISREELDQPVWQYSSGMRIRLALTRVHSQESGPVLLDEPDRSLDLDAKAILRAALKRIARETGRTVVITTHDLHLASEADRAIVLRDGSIAATADAPDLERLNSILGSGNAPRS